MTHWLTQGKRAAGVGLGTVLGLVGCKPCAGLAGEELQKCEAEQAAAQDAGTTGGTGGSGGSTSDTSLVYAEDFENGFDGGTWGVDSTSGVHGGVRALRPPALQARDEARVTFACGDVSHTQLSFWWNQVVGQNASCCNALPTETLGLDLYVDGTLRATFGNLGGWQRALVNVTPEPHVYEFVARSAVDTSPWGATDPVPPFVLDDFECRYVEPEPAHNQHVTFDDHFIPTEIDGEWLVGSTRGVQEGEAAIHPPPLRGGASSTMTFDCDDVTHTQFSFWWNQVSGQNASCCNALPTTDLAFELKVDGQLREIFGRAGGWQRTLINVERGPHTYEFTARAKNDTTPWGSSDPVPPFVLDSFDCIDEEPTAAVNGRIGFDGQFVPPEVTGGWLVGNTRGVGEGEAAVHPPALEAGEDSTMIVDCSTIEHSGLSFLWNQIVGQNASCCNALPTEDLAFDLVIDDGDPITFGRLGGWKSESIGVPPGGHVYKFTARSRAATVAWGTTDPTPPFVIDSIVCN